MKHSPSAVFFDLDDTLIRFPSKRAKALLVWEASKHLGTLFSERRPQWALPFSVRVLAEARHHLLRERAFVTPGEHTTVHTSIASHWTLCLQEALERLGRIEAHEHDLSRVSAAFFQGAFARVALRTIRAYPAMVSLIKDLRQQGLPLVLATNPFVPRESVGQRLAAAGLSFDDFRAVTFAENSRFLKPSAYYYEDLLNHMGLNAREVVMIGNDPVRDGAARQVGIRTLIVAPHRGDTQAAREAKAFVHGENPIKIAPRSLFL